MRGKTSKGKGETWVDPNMQRMHNQAPKFTPPRSRRASQSHYRTEASQETMIHPRQNYVVHTDYFIGYFRGEAQVLAVFRNLRQNQLFLSTYTFGRRVFSQPWTRGSHAAVA